MDRTERNPELDESAYLLRQLTELTRRGLLTWECIGYTPIQLSADEDGESTIWYIIQALTVRAHYEARTYHASLYESLRSSDGVGFIMTDLNVAEGDVRIEPGSAVEPNVLCLFPKDAMFAFAGVVLQQVGSSDAVKAGFADKFFPYGDAALSSDFRRDPLICLGRYLRDRRQALSFHNAVMDKAYRNRLIAEHKSGF